MFSVIIPTFNRANYIKRAIDSVLNQSYKDFELIVIDDGSSDNTPLVLKSYKDKIKVITNKSNKGVSYSRNIGIKIAKNPIIAFLDSDDEWRKDKLLYQAKFFEKNPSFSIVQTNERWIRDGAFLNKKKIHLTKEGNIFYNSLHLCLISPSAVAIKKEVFEDVGYFDESFEVCEDYDLWLRVTKKYKVGYIDKELVIKYGGHSDQLSKKYFAMDRWRVKALLKLLEKEIDKEVLKVAIKKSQILIKGAKKHNNKEILDEFEPILKRLKEMEEKVKIKN